MGNISLRQLQDIEQLSVRSYHVCQNANFESLYDVLSYYVEKGSFLRIRLCGKTSNIELVRLCLKYFNNEKIDTISQGWDLTRLTKDNELSKKAARFCELKDLTDLKSILNHYITCGTFLNLYCANETDNELNKFCIRRLNLKSSDFFESSDNPTISDLSTNLENTAKSSNSKVFDIDIPLNELLEIEPLTVRSKNVLNHCGLNSINRILIHYRKYGTFRNLQNAGNRTDTELISLSLKYINILSSGIESTEKDNQNGDSQDFWLKYQLMENRLRGKYGFHPFTIEQLKPDLISNKIFLPGLLEMFMFKETNFKQRDKDILNLIINNIGTLESVAKRNRISRERARQIKVALEKKINSRSSIFILFANDFLDFCKCENLILTKNLIIVDSSFFKSIKEGNEDVNDQIVLFTIELLNRNYTFYKKGIKLTIPSFRGLNRSAYCEMNLLKNDYIINNDIESFSPIMLLEYVLRIICSKLREDYVLEEKDLLSASVVGYKPKYNLLQNNLSQIDKDLKNEIKKIWTDLRSSLYLLLKGKTSSGIKSPNGSILLAKGVRIASDFIENINLTNIEDWNWTHDSFINDFLLDLAAESHSKINYLKSTYELQKSELISEFNLKYSPYLEFIDNILFAEYGLIRTGKIIISKNTHERIPDIIYKILKERGQPMHITEIYNELNKRAPGRIKDKDSIRGSVGKVPNLITFGRSSTYGLKEWENEKNIKGGTIRGLVKDFLEESDMPMHIEDILTYINQYRCTTASSVITNLKLMTKDIFIYYDGSYVGLKTKERIYAKQKFDVSIGSQISVDELLNNIFG